MVINNTMSITMNGFNFRAWHKDRKEMLYESYPGESFQWLKDGQPVEITQSLGRWDQNGYEMFVGDIVACVSGYRCLLLIDGLHDGLMKVKDAGGKIEEASFPLFHDPFHVGSDYIIVGNKFENENLWI